MKKEISGACQEKPKNMKRIFTPETYREWEEVCALFKKVTWVRYGGKKLRMGKMEEEN